MKPDPFHFDSEGHQLAGFYVRPAADLSAKDTLLVLCHGLPAAKPQVTPCDTSDGGYEGLANRFATLGYQSVFFNFRGAGESQGDFSLGGWLRDASALLDYQENSAISYRKVVFVASSAGALVSIVCAGNDKRIAGVASLAAPADFGFLAGANEKLLIDHFRDVGILRDPSFPADSQAWCRELFTICAVEPAGRIAPRPLLLVHGDKDDTVPVDHAHRIASAAECELSILSGCGHRLRMDEQALKRVERWLFKHFS